MSAIDKEPFPRIALIGAATLIALSLIAAGGARYLKLANPGVEVPAGEPLAARDLTFLDADDGSVLVMDGSGETVVAVLAPGTNGFIRGVLRGMARSRRALGVDQAPPFRLAAWPDGRLTLQDMATEKSVELNSFGADNRAAFARLLTAEGRT